MPTSKWFWEKEIPGKRTGNVKHGFLIKKLIFQGKTKFQKVLIFDNPLYGRVFCVDDIVQFSESDEFIYHEMISHPILFSHPQPENILIIGGGDGGALREVIKHPVKKIDLVEIDKEIIEISKKYLGFVSQGSFSDKRVKIHYLPGEEFVKKCKDFYDVVIVDCTNFSFEKNISSSLFSVRFYQNVKKILKKEGMIISLGASFLDFENFIKKIFKRIKKVFPYVTLFKFCISSYHCGEYCFIAGSKKIDLRKVDFKKIEKRYEKIKKKHKFQYYCPKIHFACQVLPKIWEIK